MNQLSDAIIGNMDTDTNQTQPKFQIEFYNAWINYAFLTYCSYFIEMKRLVQQTLHWHNLSIIYEEEKCLEISSLYVCS